MKRVLTIIAMIIGFLSVGCIGYSRGWFDELFKRKK